MEDNVKSPMPPQPPEQPRKLRPGEFLASPPKRCLSCGKKIENMDSRLGKGWIILGTLQPGVVLFGCPKCAAVYMNKDAATNMAQAKELGERRIITP